MTKTKYWTVFLLRAIGNSLLIGAFFWGAYIFFPVFKVEAVYRWERVRGVEREMTVTAEEIPAEAPRTSFGEILKKPRPLTITPVSFEFGIVIPKINANAVVVANVDPGNKEEYMEKLLEGIAHARGTVFPGEVGNSYLFSHSVAHPWEVSRYNAQFWLLSKLEDGDMVFVFYDGKQYDYKVVEKVVVSADETSWLTAGYAEPTLTLQTCDPPGTTWRRLMVIAKLVASED